MTCSECGGNSESGHQRLCPSILANTPEAPVKASDLLLESAGPFDKACMLVREMEAELAARRRADADFSWHDVVFDCERAIGADGTAESPLSSNLANLIRDMKRDLLREREQRGVGSLLAIAERHAIEKADDYAVATFDPDFAAALGGLDVARADLCRAVAARRKIVQDEEGEERER